MKSLTFLCLVLGVASLVGAKELLKNQLVPPGSGYGVPTYNYFENNTYVQWADDFTVPDGMQWQIESVYLEPFTAVGVDIVNFTVQIWSHASTLFGEVPGTLLQEWTGRESSPVDWLTTIGETDFEIDPVILDPGVYWVSVVPLIPGYASDFTGPYDGKLYLNTDTLATSGNQFAVRSINAEFWANQAQVEDNWVSNAFVDYGVAQLQFQLYGTVIEPGTTESSETPNSEGTTLLTSTMSTDSNSTVEGSTAEVNSTMGNNTVVTDMTADVNSTMSNGTNNATMESGDEATSEDEESTESAGESEFPIESTEDSLSSGNRIVLCHAIAIVASILLAFV